MWRKDEKPKAQSSNVPEPVATTPKPIQSVAPAAAAVPAPIAQTSASTPATNYAAPAVSAPVTRNSASVIGAGLKIQGEITGDSDLVIEGEAHGRIRMMNGRVTVAAHGRVNADIEAVEITVDGSVQGGLKASDRVRLGASSQVQGSVMTPRIAIEDGARLRGKVEMIRAGEVAATPVVAPAAKTPVVAPVTTIPAATTSAPPVTGAANTSTSEKANAARVSGD
ncbi:MAG TPA: polymer-forming cytoskeletal protein [Candidatus Acidoferrales bacterium]